MNRLIVLFLIVIVLLVQSVSYGEMRNWTGSNNKVIQAEFVSYDPSSEIVKIRLKDGREQSVKINLFSKTDQDFVKSKGKADDPFSTQESESVSDSSVVRISLKIDEYGNSNICVEKTSNPHQNTFEGKEIKLDILPKAKIKVNDKGISNLVFDFKTSDSLPFWDFFWKGTKIDEKAKMLTINPPEGYNGMTMFGFSQNVVKFPLEMICDVSQFNGELFNSEIIFDSPTKMEVRSILTCRVASKSGSSGPYTVHCRWGKTAKGKGWDFQDIIRVENLALDKPFESKFRLQVSEGVITDTFRMSIGKNMNSDDKNPTDLAPIGISRLEFTTLFSLPLAVLLESKNNKVSVKTVFASGIGEKLGIQKDDIIVSINGIRPHSLQMATDMLTGTSLDESLVVKIERNGKQQEIIVFEK